MTGKPNDALTDMPEYSFGKIHRGIKRSSFYVTMRDGVKIAVDLYMPKKLGPEEKIPAVVSRTRYWRRFRWVWPVSLFAPSSDYFQLAKEFCPRGYAWVHFDVRGSGASFGTQSCCFSRDETEDGNDLVAWITGRPWSNGKIGAFGISYGGTGAEFLALHPGCAVRAVVPSFALYDAWDDVVFPGGIRLEWFTATWSSYNRALDSNRLPETVPAAIRAVNRGVAPVDDDRGGNLLKNAIGAHGENFDVHEAARSVEYRDDAFADGLTIDGLSPFTHARDFSGSGCAVCGISGWYDGAYSRAAVKRFLSLPAGGNNMLVLGPWSHGGRYACGPVNPGVSRFDRIGMLLRFFDHHLKNGNGLNFRVLYYTLVEEAWKRSETWPPESHPVRYYLSGGLTLGLEVPAAASGSDRYEADFTHGTGGGSRWNSLMRGEKVAYDDRAVQDEKCLAYTGSPLSGDLEVTGHPVVYLYVSSDSTDGAFFAYLEDVRPDGTVRYVSEGMLRVLHRNERPDGAPYAYPGPYHGCTREDARPLVPGEPALLRFEILPVSYLFKAGDRIRLSIACADRDHFATIPERPPVISVHRSALLPSHLELPIVGPA